MEKVKTIGSNKDVLGPQEIYQIRLSGVQFNAVVHKIESKMTQAIKYAA